MLLVIQGTQFCNIDCSYCYLPLRNSKKRISRETLQRLVTQLIDVIGPGEEVNVVWHAGEPLVLPISFYEDAFAAFAPLREQADPLTHGFQTNGTLIDNDWISFFARHHPILGVSIDGPQDIHDRHRRYRNGAGNWQRCLAGIRLLQAAALPFHTISVLTEPALRVPDRMFDFFVDNALFDIGFNIEEAEGAHPISGLATSGFAGIEPERLYGDFLRRFLQRNAAAGHPIRLREAEAVAAMVLSGEMPFNAQAEMGRIISVDVDGNVATFSPELLGLTDPRHGDFIIGNLWQSDLGTMLQGAVATSLAREIAIGVERCRESCAFFPFCKGGAPVNKLCETGSFRATETMYCRLTVKATVQACVDAVYGSLAR